MRVLLDATAVPPDRGGVGRYVDELAPELDRAGVDLVLAVQQRDVEHYSTIVPGARVVAAPAAIERRPVRMLWEQAGLPALVRKVGADLLHSPHYTMPRRAGVPVVVTLHDATFFSTPELHLRTKAVFFRSAIRSAVARAEALVVPSLATRDEVRRLVGGDEARFHVAYHGVDHELFRATSASEQARVRASLDIGDRPYVGFLGTLEPRKNVAALVRAWVQACAGRPDAPALVLAGGKGWDTQIESAVAEVPPHLVARLPGYLPLADLPAFLGGAQVLAYPSLGEGFGLPVLEAMACGATVLTTRELSLPEVGGDAVAYCGTDPASIATELGALLDDPARRGLLAVRATARAQEFTWARAARTHVDAFEQALALR